MFYELAGIKYGDVMMDRNGPLAAQFIVGSALNDIATAKQQEDE
jgi:hypothetical protein